MKTGTLSQYDKQAAEFLALSNFALTIERTTPQKCPAWENAGRFKWQCPNNNPNCGNTHGLEYWVTLRKKDNGLGNAKPRAIGFSFWSSYADTPEGQLERLPRRKTPYPAHRPSAYDVLSCLASDSSMPETADEVFEEFGEMKPSRAEVIAEWGRKVRAFFTAVELEALQQIQ